MTGPSHKSILSIAIPMMASNLSVPLLGAVDTAVMGHLPQPHYIGAVAVGSTIFSFLFWSFGFLRMGTTGLTAQAQGAGLPAEAWIVLTRACVLALAAAAGLWLLQWPLREFGLWFANAPRQVDAAAATYFGMRIWSAPAVLLNYVAVGWLLGMQAPKRALAVLLTINVANIALDLLFVVVFNWGVTGVASASVVAEAVGCLVAGWLVLDLRKRHSMERQIGYHYLLQWSGYRRMLAVGRDIMIRTGLLVFAFAFFIRQSAAQGTVALAANSVSLQFVYLMSYCVDGFAQAAEVYSGKYWGARDPNGFAAATRRTALWCGLVAAAFALLYWVAGPMLVNLLTDLESVRDQANAFWIWVVVIPLVGTWSFLYDGIFIGATWTRQMRQVMLLATASYLACWYVTQPWGNHGIWFALLVFYGVRGGGMAALYRPSLAGMPTT